MDFIRLAGVVRNVQEGFGSHELRQANGKPIFDFEVVPLVWSDLNMCSNVADGKNNGKL